MKIWKNTPTLDHLVSRLNITVECHEAELAVIGGKAVDLNKMPNLKGLFKCGVGIDNVPVEEAKKRGIKIGLPSEQTRQYIFEETANFTVYLILSLLYSQTGQLETWEKKSRVFLGNQKVLIIGMGNIGTYVIKKLRPIAHILTFDITQNKSEELRALIEQADIISLHIPLTKATEGFINAEKLSWMKDGAALVNTARGPIVDEDALYSEIKNKRLKAAFDVYWEEPYHGKLAKFHPHGFRMSPHVASCCESFLTSLANDLDQFQLELEAAQNI